MMGSRGESLDTLTPLLGLVTERASRHEDAWELERDAASVLPPAVLGTEVAIEAVLTLSRDPRAYPLLAAMAYVTPEPVSAVARAAAERLADEGHGVPLPAGLGKIEPERGIIIAGEGETASCLAVAYSRPGSAMSEMATLRADHLNTAGAIAWAMHGPTGGDPIGQLEESSRESGLEPTLLTATEVADEARAWIGRSIAAGYRPTGASLGTCTLLLGTAPGPADDALLLELATVESYDEAFGELDEDSQLEAEVDDYVDALARWVDGQGLDEERAQGVVDAGRQLAEYRVWELDAGLVDWERQELRDYLLDYVPRKLTLPAGEIGGFVDDICDVLAHAAAIGLLSRQRAEALAKIARNSRPQMERALADPANWGPSKAIVAAMLEDGIEITDAVQTRAWIARFNELTIEQRDAILGPGALERADLAFTPPASPSPHGATRKKDDRKAQRQARKRNRKGR
jgi:hypothetical protein